MMNRMMTISGISIEESPNKIHITAADGFDLTVNRIAGVWRFEFPGVVTRLCHFNLRKQIHDALNGNS